MLSFIFYVIVCCVVESAEIYGKFTRLFCVTIATTKTTSMFKNVLNCKLKKNEMFLDCDQVESNSSVFIESIFSMITDIIQS